VKIYPVPPKNPPNYELSVTAEGLLAVDVSGCLLLLVRLRPVVTVKALWVLVVCCCPHSVTAEPHSWHVPINNIRVVVVVVFSLVVIRPNSTIQDKHIDSNIQYTIHWIDIYNQTEVKEILKKFEGSRCWFRTDLAGKSDDCSILETLMLINANAVFITVASSRPWTICWCVSVNSTVLSPVRFRVSCFGGYFCVFLACIWLLVVL